MQCMSQAPNQNHSTADDATDVVRALRAAGHVAYFAGGCVRDVLLGVEPKDYDVATDAPPERVRELFKKTQAVGQAFGVILVRIGQSVIEVATFRTDGVYADGRRPSSVSFTDAEHDAQRRDFTINGLFYDPLEHRVIDFVDGQIDLQNRVLRAIGDPATRFNEDYLRLLRAIRFAARFDLNIDPQTLLAIEAAAPHLTKISGERVADELRRMLTPPTRSIAFTLLWKHGLLDGLCDAIATSHSKKARPLDPSRSLLMHLSPGAPITFGLAWLAAMIDRDWHTLHINHLGTITPDVTRRRVSSAKSTLKLSNDELDEMSNVSKQVHALLTTREPGVAMLKRFLASRSAGSSRALLDAFSAIGVAVEIIAPLKQRFEALEKTDFAPLPLVTGDDLVRAGFSPGPAFKKVLDSLYDAQLEGKVNDPAAAMQLAVRLLSK